MSLRTQILAFVFLSNLGFALPHVSTRVDWEPHEARETARVAIQAIFDANRSAWAKEMGFRALSLDHPLDIPIAPKTATGILSRGFVSEIFDPMVFSFANSADRLGKQIDRHPIDSLTLDCRGSRNSEPSVRLAALTQLQKIRRIHFILTPTQDFFAATCVQSMRTLLSSPHLKALRSVRLSLDRNHFITFNTWREILELPVMRQLHELYVESNTYGAPTFFLFDFLRFDWSNLRALGLDRMGLDNADAMALGNLPGFRPRFLSLRQNRFTLDLFERLSRQRELVSQLEDIDLTSNELSRGRLRFDQAWAALTLFPKLHTLRMANTQVRTTIAITALAHTPLPNLRRLDVSQGDDPGSRAWGQRTSPAVWREIARALASNTGLRGLRSLRLGHERVTESSNTPYLEGLQALADSEALPELLHLEAPLYGYLDTDPKKTYTFTFPSPRRGLPKLHSVRIGATVNGICLRAGPIQFLNPGPGSCAFAPQE